MATEEQAQQEADEQDLAETQALQEEAETTKEYIEYLGEEPHGTAFLTSHSIPKGDPVWKRAGVSVSKDLTWERDPYGPPVGQKGSRMLLAVEDLPAGAAEALEKVPGYKRVTVE